MDPLSAAGAIVGFAVPVFQCAKAVRDRIKLVASEKSELLVVLVEYEKDINLLESLYNEHKALLDQHHLDADLKELEQVIRDLDQWLNSINPDLGKKLPSIKELWRSGDLREKMVAANTKISSIRNRWQTRLQVCTLASTTAIIGRLGLQDSGQAEMRSMLQQMTQMISMLQHGPVRQRARTLSMHSQVEPAGFNSQTTRVVADTSTSTVTFSILSPDASLAYDRIKLRLVEYRSLLESDSDTIELSTENGKTVICQKQANEMGEYLSQAEALLQDIVQSHNISTLVILHRLRDLAKVLDDLKLSNECNLTSNCALELAEAMGRRSIEFRHEHAETLALIAGLSVYRARAHTLFIRAVSICEEVVTDNASQSNKWRLLNILYRAGYWSGDHPELGAQWLGRAVQLMTKELPSIMVTPLLCGTIYYNYGVLLQELQQHTKAAEVYRRSISIRRTLANNDPVKYTHYLVAALHNMGFALYELGELDDAFASLKEALELWKTAPAQDPAQYDAQLADILYVYGSTIHRLGQVSESVNVLKEAITLYHNIPQAGAKHTDLLCSALYNYGLSCHKLGQHAEAVIAYQESIPLLYTLDLTDTGVATYLMDHLHIMANSLHALGRNAEADAAATEALQMNQGNVVDNCIYMPDYSSCFVCQRAILLHDPLMPLPAFPGLFDSSVPEASVTRTSAHTPLTGALDSVEHGQIRVVPGPPAALDADVPSLSSSQPLIQDLTDSSAFPARPIGGTKNVSQHRKRDKVIRLFRRNRIE